MLPLVPLETVGVSVPLWLPTFLSPLELEYMDGRNWRVTVAFNFESAVLKRIISVPQNFVTDFASIPRVLWNLLPPTGQYGKAAVLHDLGYRSGGGLSREQADDLLFEGMTVLGVGWITRWTIYAGVRSGGHWAYHGGR